MFTDNPLLLVGLAAVTLALPQLALRWQLPLLRVASRWARWLLCGVLFATGLELFELSTRPAAVHFVTGLALWFLLETGYNWIAIKALSQSDLPLFPKFRINQDGDEWPADRHALAIKDWLRAHNYQRLDALKAELYEKTYLRTSIYQHPETYTRLQVLFIPQPKGGAIACFTLTNQGPENQRLITDNYFLPYGGFYPQAWQHLRKPLLGSLARLHKLHEGRLKKSAWLATPFEDSALEEVDEQQRTLEQLNIETGFLVPRSRQAEEGKMTYEGRYRLWKEMWLLAYFGKSMS